MDTELCEGYPDFLCKLRSGYDFGIHFALFVRDSVWAFAYQYACRKNFDVEIEFSERFCRSGLHFLCRDDAVACDGYCPLYDIPVALSHLHFRKKKFSLLV